MGQFETVGQSSFAQPQDPPNLPRYSVHLIGSFHSLPRFDLGIPLDQILTWLRGETGQDAPLLRTRKLANFSCRNLEKGFASQPSRVPSRSGAERQTVCSLSGVSAVHGHGRLHAGRLLPMSPNLCGFPPPPVVIHGKEITFVFSFMRRESE